MDNVSYPTAFNTTGIVGYTPARLWPGWSCRQMFEEKGIDVQIIAQHQNGATEVFPIEIKVKVDDNFAQVLRQMHALNAKYLFLEDYEGEGVSRDTFISMFEKSGKTVIFKRDVDEQYRRLLLAQAKGPEPDPWDDWTDYTTEPDLDFD